MNQEKSFESIPPLAGGNMEIRVQRHDDHIKGHLTPEGKEHAYQEAYATACEALDENPNTHFMVVASDQVLDETEPGLGGIRAQETADEVIKAIRKALQERGLSEEQLFGYDNLKSPATSSPVIREADIFNNGFMKKLREKYPNQGPWSLYYEDVEREMREEMGAESAAELAKRMDYMFKVVEMAGASFYRDGANQGVPLKSWIVGHGGGLDAYLRKYANVPLDQVGFPFSGGFTIQARGDKLVAIVKGNEYEINEDEEMSMPYDRDPNFQRSKE